MDTTYEADVKLMKKYLLWIVCLLRGHAWVFEDYGQIGEWNGSETWCKRSHCERCGMYCFERVNRRDL